MTDPRIGIIEHDAEMLALIVEILKNAGQLTVGMIVSPGCFDEVKRLQPAALVVDVLHDHPEDWQFLDDLRIDPATASIPVLVVTTSNVAAERAMSSYNVRRVVVKPFDIDDLIGRLEDALQGRPMPPITAPDTEGMPAIFGLAADVLARESRNISLRWVQEVMLAEPYHTRSDLHVSDLLDAVPPLMEALVAALRMNEPPEVVIARPEVAGRAEAHAIARFAKGIPIWGLNLEYKVLRNRIWRALRRGLRDAAVTVDDVLTLALQLGRMLDTLMEIAVRTYAAQESKKHDASSPKPT